MRTLLNLKTEAGGARKKLKRAVAVVAAVALPFLFSAVPRPYAAAGGEGDAGRAEETQRELSDGVRDQLNNLDLGELEKYLSNLSESDYGLFGGKTFREKIQSLLNGDYKIGYDTFLSAAVGVLFSGITEFLPLLAAIAAVTVLYGVIHNMRPEGAGAAKAARFACMSVVALLVTTAVTKLVLLTRSSMLGMQTQMNAAFPILLTLMTATGGGASASVYQPATAVLGQAVTGVMIGVVMPAFLFSLAFNITGSLSDDLPFKKMPAFFSSLCKWITGTVFALFTAFLGLQGITAATHDTISLRTAKYAVSHYVPLIGGYLSDGLNLITAGTILIKNAVGFSCALLLLIAVLRPIIVTAVFILGLKLTAAILEPVADSKVSNFLTSAAKSLNILVVMVFAVGFMYFITLMLIIGTGNNLI